MPRIGVFPIIRDNSFSFFRFCSTAADVGEDSRTVDPISVWRRIWPGFRYQSEEKATCSVAWLQPGVSSRSIRPQTLHISTAANNFETSVAHSRVRARENPVSRDDLISGGGISRLWSNRVQSLAFPRFALSRRPRGTPSLNSFLQDSPTY